ncbi:MAG: serine/threonine protein phosphatase [Candidatus Lokiarchaeota archaeon]|nr:serine/threonine protein phosphatase [Candidatus Lokiarchaeota archaeon]
MIIDRFVEESPSHEELFALLRAISIADVKVLIYKVEDALARERTLVRLPAAETFVIGDMHGDIAAALAIARQLMEGGPGMQQVFLGDYVDRGPHQVDVINLVLLLKATYPGRVTMLRGNHEIPAVNGENGFRECLERQFGREDGAILWHLYNRLFMRLPLAAITWNGIFLVHGGIPEGVNGLHEIEALPRELVPENRISFELLWNDPVEAKHPFHFRKGPRGGATKQFGELAFDEFQERTNISKLIRGHEEFNEGFRFFFGERVLSIFSSRRVLHGVFERQIRPKVVKIDMAGNLVVEAFEPAAIMT